MIHLVNQQQLERSGYAAPWDVAIAWLSGLFLTEDDPITWQTFDDKGEDRTLARWFHGSLVECWDRLESLNARGAGVFAMINEGDGTGRRGDCVQRVRAVFVDIDKDPPSSWHLPPSMVIASGRGLHAYWAVQDLAVAQFKESQKRLIRRYRSDRAVHDLPRVMRVAGFDHCKGERVRVEIAGLHPWGLYSAAEVLAGLPLAGGRKQAVREARQRAGKHDQGDGFGDWPIVAEFEARGLLGRALQRGQFTVACPWIDGHTTARDPHVASDTVIWEGQGKGGRWPQFHCSHDSCAGRSIVDVLREWGAIG